MKRGYEMNNKFEEFKKKYVNNIDDFVIEEKQDGYYIFEFKNQNNMNLIERVNHLRQSAVKLSPFKFVDFITENEDFKDLKDVFLIKYDEKELSNDFYVFFEYKKINWRIKLLKLKKEKNEIKFLNKYGWDEVYEDFYLVEDINCIKNKLIDNIINNSTERISLLFEKNNNKIG